MARRLKPELISEVEALLAACVPQSDIANTLLIEHGVPLRTGRRYLMHVLATWDPDTSKEAYAQYVLREAVALIALGKKLGHVAAAGNILRLFAEVVGLLQNKVAVELTGLSMAGTVTRQIDAELAKLRSEQDGKRQAN